MNLLVCAACDARLDPQAIVDAELLCPACDHHQPVRLLPLLCLTGPSGTGKSAGTRLVADRLSDQFVVLEQDVLWQAGLRDADRQHPVFRTAWLRMAAMIHQSGRPVLLVGTVVPPELEPLPERALFSGIHYLSLTCDTEVLADRLRARPPWREWDEERIAETVEFAGWVQREAASMSPPMTLLDTTDVPVAETARAVVTWARETAASSGMSLGGSHEPGR